MITENFVWLTVYQEYLVYHNVAWIDGPGII